MNLPQDRDPLQTTQLTLSENMIDFGIGQPDLALLPWEILRQAADHRLQQPERGLLQYGAEKGDGHFRRALAAFLSAGYGTAVSPEHLFVTNGVSQALDLICTLFTSPGDLIFVEEPTYFLALRIFADHQLRLVSLPVDEQGLVIELLEEALARETPVFLYTIPTYQNPTGVTLPQSRRRRLLELSHSHGFYLVADEVYHLLGYESGPPTPFASYRESETLLSLGSFSKILAPGLRLGWIQAAPALLQRLANSGMLESGGGLNPFVSGIVRSTLELGWQEDHLRHLRTTYQQRAAALSHALRRHLSGLASFAEPQGGFFIWLKLAQMRDTSELLPLARQRDVAFQPGVKFSSRHGLRQYMRLCFAFYDVPTLEEGVVRLRETLAPILG
jgi:DNA-binding transcriptional MocR family regulator